MLPPNGKSTLAGNAAAVDGEALTFQGSPVTFSDGSPLTFSDGSRLAFSEGESLRYLDGEPLTYSDGSPLTYSNGEPLTFHAQVPDIAAESEAADIDVKLASLGEQLDRVEIVVRELVRAQTGKYRAGIGHNNPPEDIESSEYPTLYELRGVQLSIDDVRSELSRATTAKVPDAEVLERARGRLEWLGSKLKWIAEKMLTGGVTTIGGLTIKAIIEDPRTIELLHTTASIVGEWAHVAHG